MGKSISIITVVDTADIALNNLVTNLSQSALKPDELIVVGFNEAPQLPDGSHPFTTKAVAVPTSDWAEALNTGWAHARGDFLVFIDALTLISALTLKTAVEHWCPNTLMTTQVLSVPPEKYNDGYDSISSCRHYSSSPALGTHYGMLNHTDSSAAFFLIDQKSMEMIGGFDPVFDHPLICYEDFFRQCREQGLEFSCMPVESYRLKEQDNQTEEYKTDKWLNNVNRFRQKWGAFPSHSQLTEHALAGRINRDFEFRGVLRTSAQ